jgi:integrase
MSRHLDQIRPSDIQDWRDKRLKQVAKGTVNREMNTLSGVFSFAIEEWRIPLAFNPVHQVKRPPNSDVKRDRRWEQSEIDAVLTASGFDPQQKPTNLRAYAGWAIAIAIETAMRKGELLKVTAKDYRPADQYLFVPDTKNGENRKVPLSTKAIALLDVLVKGLKPTDKIFPLSSSWLAQCFDKAKLDAGLADANLRLHDGRHEAATRLSEKLSNVLELSAVTGHKSLQSLKRYYNPKPADLAAKLG